MHLPAPRDRRRRRLCQNHIRHTLKRHAVQPLAALAHNVINNASTLPADLAVAGSYRSGPIDGNARLRISKR
jgi:hypothetical protein